MACVNDKYFTDPTVRCVAKGVVHGACNYRQLRPAWEWEHLIGGQLVEEEGHGLKGRQFAREGTASFGYPEDLL